MEVLYHLGAIEAATGRPAAAGAAWADCARRAPRSRYGLLCEAAAAQGVASSSGP